MNTSSTFRLLLAISLFGAWGGCRSTSPDGEDPATRLHHHNWWNYYRRGAAYLEQGQYSEARMDFERCLGKRAGATYSYPFDVWRARTYGLHFVEGYFPHRELGISCYYLGDLTNAQSWLEKSLQQQPSGRAKHYLNLTRKNLLLQQHPSPPHVSLSSPTPAFWQKDRRIDLSGEARGNGLIDAVRIDGQPEFVELAEPMVSFTRTLPLKEGLNSFVVQVRDLIGQTTSTSFSCMADWQPPELLIKSVAASGSTWMVEGLCLDDHALLHVGTEDRTFLDRTHSSTGSLPTQLAVQLVIPEHGSILFTARDAAGNELRTLMDAASLRSGPTPYSLAAQFEPGIIDTGASPTPTPGKPSGNDDQPPYLRLLTPTETIVYDDEFFLDAQVGDAEGVAGVTIDGKEQFSPDQRGFLHARLARRLPVAIGTNTFLVQVTDTDGHQISEQFRILRKQPAYLDTFLRLTLRLFPVYTPSITTTDMTRSCERIRNALEGELLVDPPRFWVLEREENMETILREHLLSVSELSDPRAVLRLGKILPAELLMTTALIPHGQGATILSKIIDPDGGTVMCSEDVYVEALASDPAYQLGGLALKVEQHFPLLAGKITHCSSDIASVSVGRKEGLRQGIRFLVIEPPETGGRMEEGQVIMHKGKPVELVVADAETDQASARVVPKQAGRDIKTGYYIYAK